MGRYFERKASKLINIGWKHGRWADFWSFVHLLSGLIFGILALLLGVPPLYALIAILIGAIAYECLELLAHVVEDPENSLIDILLAGAGAAIALYGFDALRFSIHTSALMFIGALLVNTLLIHLGWNAYLKRKAYAERSHKYLSMVLQGVTLLSIIAIGLATVEWVW